MFCNQCEQTAKGVACTVSGVCGKKPEVAQLQDLLTYAIRGLSRVAFALGKKGITKPEIDRFVVKGLFTTLTNVNFDPESLVEYIRKAVELRENLISKWGNPVTGDEWDDPSLQFIPAGDLQGLILQGEGVGHLGFTEDDPDLRSLKQILVYGVRGIAAYAHHAAVLGQEDPEVYQFIHRALANLTNNSLSLKDWLDLVLECGAVNLRAMELLDAGNTKTFGHPEPTPVSLGRIQGKCILVSGHDLLDLKHLLEQTEGRGINIYTHGEMLPAHGYPELKKFPHLVGHYGTAWQNQKQEFSRFPGPILMTTNCLQEPQKTYFESIFTTGPVAWAGVRYVENGSFQPIIDKALEMPGFGDNQEGPTVMTGFARNAVLGVADRVIEAVKKGDIKHFLLVGGCDGARGSRGYYAEIVEKAPNNTVILTLGCGKYRFFDRELGTIGGIPRLLDLGQCNDAYSAIQIAIALANAFECGVNDLPLSLVLSWYEQKAVAILLTLLHLGIKNIRLGPTLPAFISPGVLKVLVDNYGIKPISNADADLEAILAS